MGVIVGNGYSDLFAVLWYEDDKEVVPDVGAEDEGAPKSPTLTLKTLVKRKFRRAPCSSGFTGRG